MNHLLKKKKKKIYPKVNTYIYYFSHLKSLKNLVLKKKKKPTWCYSSLVDMAEPIYTLFSVGLRERPGLAQENKQGTFNQLFSLSAPLSSNPRAHSPPTLLESQDPFFFSVNNPRKAFLLFTLPKSHFCPACSTTYTLNSLFLYLPFPYSKLQGVSV